MLSEKDKQRIKEEEIFRSEVQKSLAQAAAPKSAFGRLRAFLNTALGIWVLSSIVLGIIGWTYTQWQVWRQNTQQINKLDIEIDARLQAAEDAITSQSFQKKDQPVYIANVLLHPPMGERMIQAEFANRNLNSLLYELMGMLPVEEQGDVLMALTEFRNIGSLYLNKELTHEETLEVQKKIFAIHGTRWKWNKMMDRQSADYNYTNNVIMRMALMALFVLLLLGLYLLFHALRNKWRKLRKAKSHKASVNVKEQAS